MRNIVIYPEDIIPNAKYMVDANGRADLLGQILIQTGIKVPPKTRTPQCLQSGIYHFTTIIRTYVYSNTPLTLQLLSLTNLPPRKQMAAANELLNPIGINLITEDELEQARANINE